MKIAKVRLSWLASISDDVVRQNLSIVINSGAPTNVELVPSAEEFILDIPEKSQVNVSLTASDTVNTSKAATLDFEVPDLAIPAAPVGLFFEILEVNDAPEV